jgi:hypothetical protein
MIDGDYDFSFEVLIDENTKLTLNLEDLLFPTEIIYGGESGCIIGLFPNDGAKDSNTIYLG